MSEDTLKFAADSLAKASTPEPFSAKPLWNKKGPQWHLPFYIQHIAHDLMEKRGMSESHAIATAIAVVKRWASGVGNVDAGTRAAASKALAEWEKLKVEAHATSAAGAAAKAVKASGGNDLSNVDKILELAKKKQSLDKVVKLAARDFSTETRKKDASKGVAMPDGSYPIPDLDALRRAKQALGRAPAEKRPAVIAHIKRRARALGAPLPGDWPNDSGDSGSN